MERIIAGLDLGTHTIKAAAAAISPDGTVRLLGVRDLPSRGISRGNIVDLAEASGVVDKLIHGLKNDVKCKIFKVVLSVGGAGFSSDRSMGSMVLHGSPRELSHNDIEKVTQAARNMSFSLDRFILHEIVEGYALDGQGGVKNPLGLFTKKLEVKLFTLFHSGAYVQNAIRCVNYAGYNVEKVCFSGIAALGCMVSSEEMANGVMYIDIGCETTKIVLVANGRIQSCSILKRGSSDITCAIAEKFKLPFKSAERLKLEIGITDKLLAGEMVRVAVRNKHRDIPKTDVLNVIKDKIDEILGEIKDELNNSHLDQVRSGIVLAGGGVLTDGLSERAEDHFNLPVRVGSPDIFTVKSPRPPHLFASCLGAIKDCSRRIEEKRGSYSKNRIARLTNRMVTFLNDYF